MDACYGCARIHALHACVHVTSMYAKYPASVALFFLGHAILINAMHAPLATFDQLFAPVNVAVKSYKIDAQAKLRRYGCDGTEAKKIRSVPTAFLTPALEPIVAV